MKVKNEQELALKTKIFKIPIEEYEEDMNTEFSKEKKKDILDLFTNHNKLRSKDEYKQFESDLHLSCQQGDLELIQIYLSETINNDSNELTFKIDKTKRTAHCLN